ncbi:MAG: TonB-dependent receptor [Acidobacteria bacterium]|nr:TonB-dependent receptor [Acidobacteriota bacterium]
MHISFALATLALVLTAAPSYAQVLYGSIVGNIKDSTGAAVPDATVSVKEAATGFARQTRTNESGQFQFTTLPGGTYEVTVTKSGFTTFATREVAVSPNSVARVDASLDVGAVSESIRVEAAPAALQTDRAEVHTELSARQFANAPLPPGRNYSHMFKVLPGFTYPRNGNGPSVDPSRAALYNVNGTSRQSNAVRIEGAGVNQIWLPHLPGYTPALESIENVNITTNSFDAETGLAGGAAINVSIKSGTNELHGSAFWYNNNNATKAKPFFLPQGERKPKAIFNQMGATMGGPIVRNKLFFFGSYEGTYDRQHASRRDTIPTAAIRRGDMSDSPSVMYDPATGAANGTGRTPFPDKIIPQARMEPISLKLQAMLPNTNLPGLTNNLFSSGAYRFNSQKIDGKINWNASNKLTLFARGGIQDHEFESGPILGELLGAPYFSTASVAGPTYGTTGSMAVGATYVLTPTFLLDGNFGYTAYDANSTELGLGKNIGKDVLGIPGTNGTRDFESGWPRFAVSNYAVFGAQGNRTRPFFNRDPRFQYVGNATWTKGSHSVRFGFDSSRQQINHTQVEFVGATGGPAGNFDFGGGPTALSGGASINQFNTYAGFLLGLPTSLGRTLQVPQEYNVRASMHSLYIRDQWQASRKLTVSLGTRWEYFPMPTRADRGMEKYNPVTNKMEVCGVGVVPKDCGVEQSKKLFAPRVGLAYRAKEDFVIRAGYGITIDPYSLARPMRTNYPLLVVLNVNGPNSFQPAGNLRNGIPAIPEPALGNGIIDIGNQVAANSLEKNYTRGYVQSWNLSMQKKLGWGFTGQAGYVATRQINRTGFRELNYANIGGTNTGRQLAQRFGRTAETRLVAPVGNAHYDSLQIGLDRRFHAGLQVGLSYTFSKAIGICCNDDSDGLASIQIPEYFKFNRAVTGTNIPHNMTTNAIWELPFGKGRRWATSGPAAWLAGGWQWNGILSLVSGPPFTVTSANTLNAQGGIPTQRADQVKSEVSIPGGAGPGQSYFDPFAFKPVTDLRLGTSGFNTLRGPGIVNLDMGIFREFRFSERFRAQFRAEAFNTTNTPHFGNPGTNVSNLQLNADGTVRALGGFTEITSLANTGRDGQDERVFRLGLKVSW